MANTDTKSKIMDAGEKLFAENGFGATSLRAITAEAEVNLAAVNYHFGSKEALLSAIIERRIGPLNQERIDMLDRIEADAGDSPPDLEEIMRAFILAGFRKIRDLGEVGDRFMKLGARMHTEANPELQQLFLKHFDEVIRRFTVAIGRAIPGTDPSDIVMGILFTAGAMIKGLSFDEDLGKKMTGLDKVDLRELVVERMIRFTAAGFRNGLAAGGKGEKS